MYWPQVILIISSPGKVVGTSRGSRLCVIISSFMFEIRTEGDITVRHVSQNVNVLSFDKCICEHNIITNKKTNFYQRVERTSKAP